MAYDLIDEECDQRRAGEDKLMTDCGKPGQSKQPHDSVLRTGIQTVEFLADDRHVHRRQRAALTQVEYAQRLA
jgi:hypothetical protein